jgi:hypothetical protein
MYPTWEVTMSTPDECVSLINEYGSEDTKLIAMLIYTSTFEHSMSRHDGMEAVLRLAKAELEQQILRVLQEEGCELRLSTTSGRTVITFPTSGDISGPRLLVVVESAARAFGDQWSLRLREVIARYLLINGIDIIIPEVQAELPGT